MSKTKNLFNRLLTASKGVNSSERQAEARVRTNDFFDLDKKEMKAEGLMAGVIEAETSIKALHDTATTAGDCDLAEVYAASLTVFAKWTRDQEAA